MLTQIYKDSMLRVFSIILGLGINILITRSLTLEERGVFGLIMNDANLIAQIFNFGIHTSALIILTKNHQKAIEYSNVSLVLIILAIISYLIWTQLFSSFSIITVFTIFTSITNLWSIFFNSGYTAIGKSKFFNISEIVKNIIICTLLLILCKISSELLTIYLIYIPLNLIFCAILTICFQKVSCKKSFKNFKFWTNNYKVSIKSYISCGLSSAFTWYAIHFAKIQQEEGIITGKMLGQFILSFNHIAYIMIFFTSISLIFTPHLIIQDDKKKILKRVFVLIFLNLLVLSIGIIIVYPWMEDIFSFIYGEKYRISGWYFKKMLPICYSTVFLLSIAPFITAFKVPLISIISPGLSLLSFIIFTQFLINTSSVIEIIDSYFYSIFIWCLLYTGFLIKTLFNIYHCKST